MLLLSPNREKHLHGMASMSGTRNPIRSSVLDIFANGIKMDQMG